MVPADTKQAASGFTANLNSECSKGHGFGVQDSARTHSAERQRVPQPQQTKRKKKNKKKKKKTRKKKRKKKKKTRKKKRKRDELGNALLSSTVHAPNLPINVH